MENTEAYINPLTPEVRILPVGLLAMPPLTVRKTHSTPVAKMEVHLPLPIPSPLGGAMQVCMQCRCQFDNDGLGWW